MNNSADTLWLSTKTCVIIVSLLLVVANKSHIVPIHLHRIVRKTDNMYSAVSDNRRGGVSNNSIRRELHGHLACGDKRTVEAVQCDVEFPSPSTSTIPNITGCYIPISGLDKLTLQNCIFYILLFPQFCVKHNAQMSSLNRLNPFHSAIPTHNI